MRLNTAASHHAPVYAFGIGGFTAVCLPHHHRLARNRFDIWEHGVRRPWSHALEDPIRIVTVGIRVHASVDDQEFLIGPRLNGGLAVKGDAQDREENIRRVIATESDRFGQTLDKGLKEFEKLEVVDGTAAFNLYQTFGFP